MALKVNPIPSNYRPNTVEASLFVLPNTSCAERKVKKDAEHVIKDFKISNSSIALLNFLDRISPYLNKHNHIRKACLYLGEKFVKFSDNI